VSTQRHHDDPNYRPLFGIDHITLSLKGRRQGEEFHFAGGTAQVPGVAFRSVMTPISDEGSSPAAATGTDGIRNGLYSIHIRMLDGVDGGNTGVMVLHDGRIRGGDAFFDYIGCYTSANGKWKGEIVNHEHTVTHGERRCSAGMKWGSAFRHLYRRRRHRHGDGAGRQAQHSFQRGVEAARRDVRAEAVVPQRITPGR